MRQEDSPSKTFLSVVFSFRNEANVLLELITRVRRVLDKECPDRYELIFVNDDSTDESESILLEEAKGRHDIKIITTSRPFGVSPCVLAGMEYSSGEAVVYMDADLQDPPEVIPELIKAWKDGDEIDVVHTKRLSRAGESRVKLLVTRLGYIILKYVSSVNLLIEAGDFKLLSRQAVHHLIRLKEKKPYLRGLVSWIGFNQTSISYHREARFAGETKFPVFSAKVIQNFLGSALISFSDVPLQLFTISGFLASIGSFVYSLYIIIRKILGYDVPDWSPLMIAVLLLGGMILLGIGVLGLYINSIYLETNKRPNYIVKRTFGFDDIEDK